MDISKYKLVNDRGKLISLIVFIFIIGIVEILNLFFYKGQFVNIFELAIYSLIFYVIFQSYRPRKCPNCKKKMKVYFGSGFIISDFHYCELCKVKIKTGVENGNWA